MDVYNPITYWQARGAHYHTPDMSKEDDYLCELIKAFALPGYRICDIGSGYGRVYSAMNGRGLLKDKHFEMFDFADSMREKCLSRTGELPIWWDGWAIPRPDKHYEFVLSSSVLMHVPEIDIDVIFAEHVRICKRFFYISTFGPDCKTTKLSPHCFDHDYDKLIKLNSLHVVEYKTFLNGTRANWLLSND